MHVWSSNNFEAAVTAANKTLMKLTEKKRGTWNHLKDVIILGPNKTVAGLQLLLFS